MKEDFPAVVALTGSIGCGKSSAAQMFQALGYTVLSADLMAREVVEPGTEGLNLIAAEFGSAVLSGDGTLNRKALGRIVFSDSEKRKKLESFLHPLIRMDFERQALGAWRGEKVPVSSSRPIIYDIPLYFESSYQHDWIKKVITVFAPVADCITRVIKRDGLTETEVTQRLLSQIPIEEKIKKSDYVLDNSGSLDQLKNQIETLVHTMEWLR